MQVSIDIETMGPAPYGRIVQIGAVAFDLDRRAGEPQRSDVQEPLELLANPVRWLDVVVAPYQEGDVDESTVEFWNSAGAADAKRLINTRPTEKITDALQFLGAFMAQFLGNNACVWAKPPAFDLGILAAHYRLFGLPVPWERRQEACLRTLLWTAKRAPTNLSVPSFEGKGLIPHYGLHDAVKQAVQAQAAFRTLMTPRRKG